jgi:hypothetical protein
MVAIEQEKEEMMHTMHDKDDEIDRLRHSAQNSESQRQDVQSRYDELMQKIKNLETDHILVPKASARASLKATRGNTFRDNSLRPTVGDSDSDARLRMENVQLQREIQRQHELLQRQNQIVRQV